MSRLRGIVGAARRARLGWTLFALVCLGALGVFAARSGFWSARELTFEWGQRTWILREPRAFALLFGVPFLWLVAGRTLTDATLAERLASILLRILFVACLVLGLSQIGERQTSARTCSVVLLDVSRSVGDAALAEGISRVQELARARPNDADFTVLTFAEGARRVPFDAERPPSLEEARAGHPGAASDLEQALERAPAYLPDDCLGRVVLLSDGVETRGDAWGAVSRLAARGIQVHAQALARDPPPDFGVLDLRVPSDVVVGKPFEVEVEVRSTERASADVELFQGASPNGLEPRKEVSELQGKTLLKFRSVVRTPGPVSYRAVVRARGEDTYPENDRASVRVIVPGPPRVLLADGRPDSLASLSRALVAQQFDVDVRGPVALPTTRAELEPFAFVVLSDVARAEVSRASEEALIDFARRGGALLFAGGEASYGPGGWQGSALEKALPVRMDDEKRRETPGVALSLLIDRSGSMTGLPLEMAKEACTATLDVLEPNDLLEVIAFDSRPTRYVKMQPARYRSRIATEVARIQPGGGTEIFSSLDMAYQDLASVEARKKHIVLLTDGNASSEGMAELVSTALAEGITVTSVGLGSGVNEELLRSIAELGGGRYHAAPEPSSLPRIFTRETEIVSQDAAREDWFPVRAARTPEFLRGIDTRALPLVRGYTRVQLAAPPSEAIFVTSEGDPILARRPLGLGYTLAWTSDWKARWGVDWLRWSGFGKFLGQLVRGHQRVDDARELPLVAELLGDEVRVRVDAFDEDERFDSGYVSTLRVARSTGEEGGEDETSLPLRLVAPGRYEARFTLPGFGSYSLFAEHRRRAETGLSAVVATSRGSIVYSYSEEFRELEPRPEVLERWAEAGRGRSDLEPAALWDPGEETIEAQVPRWSFFLAAALGVFLVDLALRRVRFAGRSRA